VRHGCRCSCAAYSLKARAGSVDMVAGRAAVAVASDPLVGHCRLVCGDRLRSISCLLLLFSPVSGWAGRVPEEDASTCREAREMSGAQIL